MTPGKTAVMRTAAASLFWQAATVYCAATLSGWWWIAIVALSVLSWDRTAAYGAAALALATGSDHPVDDATAALKKYNSTL